MTAEGIQRLPIHLGVYWHGVAERVSGGARMRSECGPYLELLAESVDRLTLVSHDPPPSSLYAEGLADYTARPTRDNIEVLSLGPLGGQRDYPARMRRVKQIVGPASETWDVLFIRSGRRANLVVRANRCPRTVSLVWGAALAPSMWRSAVRSGGVQRLLLATRQEWHLRRLLRRSGLAFTDGEHCLTRYARFVGGPMELVRSSSRRSRIAYRTDDRVTRKDATFLVVGHVTVGKGVLDAIETFRRVRSELLPEARMDVVGVGPALPEAQELTERSKLTEAVTFHGWVPSGDALSRIYRNADVLLFLSRSDTESFPRVVTEAMAHSVLVVSTPVGSLPHRYTDRRELLFVPTGQPEEAVEAVRSLRGDPGLRRDLIARAFESAEETSLEWVVQRQVSHIIHRWPELTATQTRPARHPGRWGR